MERRINTVASQLGKMAAGVPKKYSPAEIAKRTARLRKAQKNRAKTQRALRLQRPSSPTASPEEDSMTKENSVTPKTPNEAESGEAVRCSALLGRCVEAGDDDNGQPMMLIHTTRDALMRQVRNVVFEDVAVIRADELDAAKVVAFDGQARTITLRFDLMPCAAIGERWLVRPNDTSSATRPDGAGGAQKEL